MPRHWRSPGSCPRQGGVDRHSPGPATGASYVRATDHGKLRTPHVPESRLRSEIELHALQSGVQHRAHPHAACHGLPQSTVALAGGERLMEPTRRVKAPTNHGVVHMICAVPNDRLWAPSAGLGRGTQWGASGNRRFDLTAIWIAADRTRRSDFIAGPRLPGLADRGRLARIPLKYFSSMTNSRR